MPTRVLLRLLGVAAVALAAMAWLVARSPDEPAARSDPRAAGEGAELPAEPGPAVLADAGSNAAVTRVEAPAPEQAAPQSPAPEAAGAARYAGRVADMAGGAVAGCPIGVSAARGDVESGAGPALATTAWDGRFELEGTFDGGCFVALGPRWIAVRSTALGRVPHDLHLVVVAPALEIEIHVTDAGLRPLDAWVEIVLPPEAFHAIAEPLDATSVSSRVARTGPGGRLAWRVPAVEGAAIRAAHEDHPPRGVPVPRAGGEMWIELGAAEAEAGSVLGRVLAQDGRPVAGASVYLGQNATRSDGEGRFRLVPGPVDDRTPLVAHEAGRQAALIPDFGATIAAWDGAPPFVTLVLGPATLEITGHVRSSDGAPRAGFRVSLAEGTEILPGWTPPAWVESFGWSDGSVLTDASGAFRLEGLLERDYRLRSWSPETLELVVTEPIPAGTHGVVLTVPAGGLHERVSGRVLAAEGHPIAGVSVRATLITLRTANGRDGISGAPATTDAEGRFELAGVPRRACILSAEGPGILPEELELPEELPDELVIVVAERGHFRILFESAGAPPDRVEAYDAGGARVPVWTLEADQRMSSTYTPLDKGSSGVLSLGAGSYTLRFLRGSEVVHETELVLGAEAVQEIRLP